MTALAFCGSDANGLFERLQTYWHLCQNTPGMVGRSAQIYNRPYGLSACSDLNLDNLLAQRTAMIVQKIITSFV